MALASSAAACASDGSAGATRWVEHAQEAVDATPPTGADMQIDPTAGCRLIDDLEVDGKRLELFGAGTARFGEVGTRYQCAWSGDTNASANVRLEVVLMDDPAAVEDYTDLVRTRAGNETVATGVGEVDVADYTPDGATRPVTTSVLPLPEQGAGVQMVVELLDPDLAATWQPSDYAHLLARLAG